MHNRVITGNWTGNVHGLNLQLLAGKTLELIGMGQIGSKVAALAKAFAMRVMYNDPYVTTNKSFLRVELYKLLLDSDYISLHMLPSLRAILGKKEF